MQNSSAYWLGNADNESLQRVYGISFPDKKQLVEWEKLQEEAARRDHRTIGQKQVPAIAEVVLLVILVKELFFFNPLSAGCCFFLPHGTKIYNKLMEFLRVSLSSLYILVLC